MCWQGSYSKSPAFAPLRVWGWGLRTPAPEIARESLKEGKGRYDFLVLTEDTTNPTFLTEGSSCPKGEAGDAE